MKLRSFWLGGYRNLQNVTITFPQPSPLAELRPRPPIFLLVGVNGTGKTGILRALALIFDRLEDRRAPGFPFKLAYQIGRGGKSFEVVVESKGHTTLRDVNFLVTNEDGETSEIEPTEWTDYLPQQTVVYTSGHLGEWQFLLEQETNGYERREEEQSELLHQFLKEAKTIQEVVGLGNLIDFESPAVMAEMIPGRTVLLADKQLELALLATLAIEGDAHESRRQAEECRDIYRRAGIDRLRAFSLDLIPLAANAQEGVILAQVELLVHSLLEDRLEEYPEVQRRLQELLSWTPPELPEQLTERIRKLAELAVHRHRNPDGSYHLLFEMNEETRLNLGGSQGLFATSKQFFDFLADLQKRGVLARTDLILDKIDLAEPILSRHLSDGEREFLGRMALFLLMRQPESLFLLDEPETHFNDIWKRELVGLLTSMLDGRDSTALLSTHSSIVISDVAHPQLVLLVKDHQGRTKVIDVQTPTFGADPSDIAINILGAPRAGGVLSARELKAALERGDREELAALLQIVSPGYWRFRIRTRLEELDASSN